MPRIWDLSIAGLTLATTVALSGQRPLPQLGKDSVKDVIAAMSAEEKVSLVIGAGMNFSNALPDTLSPGVSQRLTFTLTPRDLASFDAASSSWIAEAGTYTVTVGASSEDIRKTATFTKATTERIGTTSVSVGTTP